MNHLLILPILVPAIVAPLLALAVRNDIVLARVFSIGSAVTLVALSLCLVGLATDGTVRTYSLGNWPAPYGIVLVLDRLAAIMLGLTSVLGLVVLLYAINGCDRRGEHFHPLFQFQLMGLNGAFLTGDLFNLFVFFEVLLIASYGLMVHGGGSTRVRAGVQYVIINSVGSSIFLLSLGLIYGVTGTLNMADLAIKVPQVESGDLALLYCGAAMLLVVFAIKSAVVPLQFWLPGTYANTSGPVAALFAIMSKVGAYSIIRIFTLVFGESAGEGAWFIAAWLMPASVLTMVLGMVGVVAARSLSQQASFAALGSIGTLMTAVAGFTPTAESAAMYYMVHSTLAIAALFLVIDAIVVRRLGSGDALIVSPRIVQSGLIASLFLITAVAVIGLPPLSGFVGKLLILDAVAELSGWPWIWGWLLGSSLLALIGFAASGSLVFWKSGETHERLKPLYPPPVALPMVAIGSVLVLLAAFTGLSGPALEYFDAAAEQLFDPQVYIEAVLGTDAGERLDG